MSSLIKHYQKSGRQKEELNNQVKATRSNRGAFSISAFVAGRLAYLVKPMKKSIRIPLVRGKTRHYPTKPLCLWCKKQKVMEPHSMAILTGGALARLGKDHYEGPTKNLIGYLGFHWHGGHDKGKGKYRENDVLYYIANEVEGGLFDIMFCSVKCLREFLNSCLDEFEQKVKGSKPLA